MQSSDQEKAQDLSLSLTLSVSASASRELELQVCVMVSSLALGIRRVLHADLPGHLSACPLYDTSRMPGIVLFPSLLTQVPGLHGAC